MRQRQHERDRHRLHETAELAGRDQIDEYDGKQQDRADGADNLGKLP